MNLNCPKCGKEIAEGDIEEKKFYCQSCIEWFTIKEESAGNSLKKDQPHLNDTTDNKRTRHKIVTIWLWVSIVVNIIFTSFIFINRLIDTSKHGVFLVLFTIAVIVGHILVLNWKIVGFFLVNVSFIIAFYVVMVASYNDKPILTMLQVIVTLSINFGMLNIRKNGTSTWRHLLYEAKVNKRKTKIWFMVVFGSIFVALAATFFPVKIMYGNVVVMFAPKRIGSPDFYYGPILGSHVLKTEYGEIRVKPLAKVTRFWGNFDIDYENFESGRASHDLVVYGINMPKNIEVRINSWFTNAVISSIFVGKNALNISGISVFSRRIDTYSGYPYGRGASLLISFADEYITLSDSTQIDVRYFEGYLDIDVYSQQWELIPSTSWFYSLGVMLPGETEFTRYKFITFKENWGAFIKGDLPDR